MKYRGNHTGNSFAGGSGGGGAGSFYHNSHQRSNGIEHGKSGRGHGGSGVGSTGSGQGQIELVEKILNQISMHQTTSNNGSGGNRGRSGANVTTGNTERGRGSYAKSNAAQQQQQPQQYSNSKFGTRFKSTNSKFVSAVNSPSSSLYAGPKEHQDRSQRSSVGTTGADNDRGRPAADNPEQCSQCEYVFTDGQLLPKFDCTHKAPTRTAASSGPKGRATSSSTQPSRGLNTNNNNDNRENGEGSSNKFPSKAATSSKAYVNRHKKGTGGNQQQQATTKAASSPLQSIIPKKKCADMKKFVEAQIVFDHNMIDVVPVAGGGPCALQLLNQPAKGNVIINGNVGAPLPLKKDSTLVAKNSAAQQSAEAKPTEKSVVKSAREQTSAATEQCATFGAIVAGGGGRGGAGGKSARKANNNSKTDVKTESAGVVHRAGTVKTPTPAAPSKNRSAANQRSAKAPPPPPQARPVVKSKSASSRTTEQQHRLPSSSSNSSKPSSAAMGSSQPQTVKKIRCLIANFITIQVEDGDLSEDYNDECIQEDILQAIDREKLGFQNFDGKNIGLYKNIGYINRNRAKFVRPTQELLQLMVSPKLHTEQCASMRQLEGSSGSDAADQPEELKLNLSQFYDLESAHSYDKEYAYSVLESLIDEEGRLTSKVKARKYRFPDCEYSSELDDFMLGHQGTSHSASISTDRPPRSSPTDKSLPWSESDNEPTMDSSSGGGGGGHGSPCPRKLKRSRYGNKTNSVRFGAAPALEHERRSDCTSFSDEASEEAAPSAKCGPLEDQSLQYGSYYITEVVWSN